MNGDEIEHLYAITPGHSGCEARKLARVLTRMATITGCELRRLWDEYTYSHYVRDDGTVSYTVTGPVEDSWATLDPLYTLIEARLNALLRPPPPRRYWERPFIDTRTQEEIHADWERVRREWEESDAGKELRELLGGSNETD